jgi:putative transposase
MAEPQLPVDYGSHEEVFSHFSHFVKHGDYLGRLIGMRQPRYLVNGAEYHVVARANRREFIFNTPRLKDLFLDIVCRAKRKYSFTIRNFCVMSNHIHFLIRPGEGESLSRIMQWILSVFAAAFNRIFGYLGHVWHDRFKSIVVGTLRQFASAFAYIADNPVKAGIVCQPSDYRHSGVRHIRDGDRRVVEPPDDLIRLLFPDLTAPAISYGL